MVRPEADFDALLGRIRSRFRLTPTDHLRLQRTAAVLLSRGIALDSDQAVAWLAPVICRSPAEQQHFYEGFGTPLPDLPPPELPGRDGRVEAAGVDPEAARRRRRRRWAGGAALVGLALLLLFLLAPPSQDGNNPAHNNIANPGGSNVSVRQAAPPPSATAPREQPAPRIGSGDVLERAAIAGLVFLVLCLGWLLARRARRRHHKRQPGPDTAAAEAAALSLALPDLFGKAAFRHALGALRRHQAVDSGKLHVGRTIRATIRAGGRPTLRYGMRPRTPEYVLLADRESPRDHLPVLAEILSHRMAEEKISATAYEYYSDPRRLQRTWPEPDPTVRMLADLAPSHPGARLMMVAERRDCLTADGEPAPWLAFVEPFDRPVLLDPGKSGGPAELALEGAMTLLQVPATPDGVLAYARRIAGQAEARADHRPGAPGRDLPDRLAGDRQRYLDDVDPGEAAVGALLADLEIWLGPEGMRLMRMTALFPLVESALTLLLASRASPPLLDEERLVRLARLPWFRAGHLPSWLRLPLVRGLSEEDLAYAAPVIHAYLSVGTQGLEEALASAGDIRLRRKLLAWLDANPGSEFHDAILIDALAGRPANALGAHDGAARRGAAAAGSLRSRLRPSLALLAQLLLLAALALVSLLVFPPAQDQSTTVAPDPPGNNSPPVVESVNGPEPADPNNNMSGPHDEPTPPPVVTQTAVARAVPIRLRSAPRDAAPIVAVIPPGEPFEVTRVDNDWWRARTRNGAVGYIGGGLIEQGFVTLNPGRRVFCAPSQVLTEDGVCGPRQEQPARNDAPVRLTMSWDQETIPEEDQRRLIEIANAFSSEPGELILVTVNWMSRGSAAGMEARELAANRAAQAVADYLRGRRISAVILNVQPITLDDMSERSAELGITVTIQRGSPTTD